VLTAKGARAAYPRTARAILGATLLPACTALPAVRPTIGRALKSKSAMPLANMLAGMRLTSFSLAQRRRAISLPGDGSAPVWEIGDKFEVPGARPAKLECIPYADRGQTRFFP
jgi:hypothetical protein